ncbi:hypothetical protein PanWU01x14_370980, partial [Parasponia andersonii]
CHHKAKNLVRVLDPVTDSTAASNAILDSTSLEYLSPFSFRWLLRNLDLTCLIMHLLFVEVRLTSMDSGDMLNVRL